RGHLASGRAVLGAEAGVVRRVATSGDPRGCQHGDVELMHRAVVVVEFLADLHHVGGGHQGCHRRIDRAVSAHGGGGGEDQAGGQFHTRLRVDVAGVQGAARPETEFRRHEAIFVQLEDVEGPVDTERDVDDGGEPAGLEHLLTAGVLAAEGVVGVGRHLPDASFPRSAGEAGQLTHVVVAVGADRHRGGNWLGRHLGWQATELGGFPFSIRAADQILERLGRNGMRGQERLPVDSSVVAHLQEDVAGGFGDQRRTVDPRQILRVRLDVVGADQRVVLVRVVLLLPGPEVGDQLLVGEVVFAPLYQVLRDRGVEFRFFHRLDGLEVDGDSVGAIRLTRQADLAVGCSDYSPLIDVDGLPAWPAAPLSEQLATDPGDALETHSWEGSGRPVRLEAGKDFDVAVLAVSLGMVPHVAADLIRSEPRWLDMVQNVATVPTRAAQLWFRSTEAELGWEGPVGVTLAG